MHDIEVKSITFEELLTLSKKVITNKSGVYTLYYRNNFGKAKAQYLINVNNLVLSFKRVDYQQNRSNFGTWLFSRYEYEIIKKVRMNNYINKL